MLRLIAACLISTLMISEVGAADPDDVIKARLDKAKADFDADFIKAKADLVALLDLKLVSATKAGELALVKKLRVERDDFVEKGEVPKSVATKDYNTAGKKAFDRMTSALIQARKEYTQASKIDEAEAVDKEFDEFVKIGGRASGIPSKPGSVLPKALNTGKVEILLAMWGAGNKNSDVTDTIRQLLAQGKTVVVNAPDLGTDPAPNTDKTLRITVKIGEQVLQMTIPDRGELKLTTGK